YSTRERGYLHPFPTRRSSDLEVVAGAGQAGGRGAGHRDICLWSSLGEEDVVPRNDANPPLPSFPGEYVLTEIAPDDLTKSVKPRSEEHTSELQSPYDLVCRLL